VTLWVGALALGLGFAGMALGVYLSFRVLSFPDLTVDGSFPLGAAVSAVLIVKQDWQPWLTLPIAFGAGVLAGCLTGLLVTRLRINGLLAGILVSLGLWTVNLRVMGGTSNLPMVAVGTVITPFRTPFVDLAPSLGVSPGDIAAVAVFGAIAVALVEAAFRELAFDLPLLFDRQTIFPITAARAISTHLRVHGWQPAPPR
jgi:ABC-type uncharacterized transport system permease subunit